MLTTVSVRNTVLVYQIKKLNTVGYSGINFKSFSGQGTNYEP